MTRLGKMLSEVRGGDSLASFSRTLGLSYTFVRSLVNGTRHPSDHVVGKIAVKLGLEPDNLLLAAHCDRSAELSEVLKKKGVDIDGLRPIGCGNDDLNGSLILTRERAVGMPRPTPEVRHSYGESG